MSPGNYDPLNLAPIDCMKTCGHWNQKYARLTESRYCFCSNTLEGDLVGDNECTGTCSGSAADKCGAFGYISAYLSVRPIRGLTLDLINNLVTTGSAVNLQPRISSGPSDYSTQTDFGEGLPGAGLSPVNETQKPHGYVMPGIYMITTYAFDGADNTNVSS